MHNYLGADTDKDKHTIRNNMKWIPHRHLEAFLEYLKNTVQHEIAVAKDLNNQKIKFLKE